MAFSLWFFRLALQLAGSVRLFIDPSQEPMAVAVIHDGATVAQDEIYETFGDLIDKSVTPNDDRKSAES